MEIIGLAYRSSIGAVVALRRLMFGLPYLSEYKKHLEQDVVGVKVFCGGDNRARTYDLSHVKRTL